MTELNSRDHIGFLSEELSRQVKMAVNRGVVSTGEDPVVVSRSWIMGYINAKSREGIVYQKELEKTFRMPKSTLADMLQTLEKNGLISRIAVENDARQKQIVMTEAGREFHQRTEQQINEVERAMKDGISEEDFEIFFSVLLKMRENVVNFKSEIEICSKKED